MEAARADAEKIRLLGGAEASAIEAVGKAEAERMRLKASAYKQYGEAAMLSLVLESLPKVGCINQYLWCWSSVRNHTSVSPPVRVVQKRSRVTLII